MLQFHFSDLKGCVAAVDGNIILISSTIFSLIRIQSYHRFLVVINLTAYSLQQTVHCFCHDNIICPDGISLYSNDVSKYIILVQKMYPDALSQKSHLPTLDSFFVVDFGNADTCTSSIRLHKDRIGNLASTHSFIELFLIHPGTSAVVAVALQPLVHLHLIQSHFTKVVG